MITIRKKQLEAFSEQLQEDFKDNMVDYLYDSYPEECEELGPEEVRDVVRYGIEVCANYGITLEYGVSTYIELMFLLGVDFDQDPELPWARQILLDESLSEQEAIDLLCVRASTNAGVENQKDEFGTRE